MQHSSDLPNPYSSCSDSTNRYNSEFSNELKNSNRTYRQTECLGLCVIQKPIEDTCGCFYTTLPSFQSLIACINSSQITCVNLKYQEQSKIMKPLSAECVKNSCPIECDTYTYETQVTNLDYPSLEYYTLMQNEFTSSLDGINTSTLDLYRQYFYSLNFYYSSTEYTYISESPQITSIGLLANLGGSLGMFLGWSVFSLIELLEIFTRLALTWFSKG